MKILVTGALGFFGLNLVRALAADEAIQVIATDVRPPAAEQEHFLQPVAARVYLSRLDIQDRPSIRALIDQWQISHLVHAAALTPTPEQEAQETTHIVDVNLGGTVNLLDAAIHCASIRRLILVSSSGVYGASPATLGAVQHEEGPLTVDNLYSITKRSAERLMQRYSQLTGLSMAAARLAPLYGPLERPASSRPRLSAVGQLAHALLNGQPLRVAGPTVRRDWTYMADAAAAVLALLRTPRLSHAIYNVSCGLAVTWREVVDLFVSHGLSATWSDDEAADLVMRPEQARLPLDITRLQTDTGFRPQYDLSSGVRAYLAQEEETAHRLSRST